MSVQTHVAVTAERPAVLDVEAQCRGLHPRLDVMSGEPSLVFRALTAALLAAEAVPLKYGE